MSVDLPEGVTLNSPEEEFAVYLPYEILDTWSCKDCSTEFEARFIGELGHWQGQIVIIKTNIIVSQERLSKDEAKAKKALEKQLQYRIERHKGTHK